jgi:hypothetical protein
MEVLKNYSIILNYANSYACLKKNGWLSGYVNEWIMVMLIRMREKMIFFIESSHRLQYIASLNLFEV